MALTIPTPISELLQEKDLAGKPLVDYEIAGEIDQIRRSLQSQSPEEQSGGWAELAAFQEMFSTGRNLCQGLCEVSAIPKLILSSREHLLLADIVVPQQQWRFAAHVIRFQKPMLR